jgi:ribosomal protein L21E
VQHHVRQDISVELSRNQVYRAKRKAREMLERDEKLQYAALWDYATMIRKTNVGSKVYIKCNCSEDGGQPRFLRMYVRYHA